MNRIGLGLFLFASWIGFAQEGVAPLDTPDITYSSSLAGQFEYYLDAIGRGYPIGTVSKKSGTGQSYDYESMVTGMSASLQKSAVALQTALNQTRQAASESYLSSIGVVSGQEQSPAKAIPPESVVTWKAGSLQRFMACAFLAVPKLKQALQSEKLGDETLSRRWSDEVAEERGDGKSVSSGGIPCGKYLGQYGVASVSTIDDIKGLIALTQRRDREAEKVFIYFILRSQAIQAPEKISAGFWRYVWRRVSYQMVFREAPVAEPADWVEDFIRWLEGQPVAVPTPGKDKKVIVTLNADPLRRELSAVIGKEWQAAEKVMEEGKASW